MNFFDNNKLKIDNNIFKYLIEKTYRYNETKLVNIAENNPDFMKILINYKKYIQDVSYAEELPNEYIILAIEKGYVFDNNSPLRLKENPKWIEKFIKYGLVHRVHIIDCATEGGLTEENIKLAIEEGYRLNPDSPLKIKGNPKYIELLIKKGQPNAIDYATEGGLTEENIKLAIEKGYRLSYYSLLQIKGNPKRIELLIKNGQPDAIDYATEGGLTEENIKLAIENGYVFDNNSPLRLKESPKWIEMFIKCGQAYAIDYATEEGLTEENIILAIEKGYRLSYYIPLQIKENPEYIKLFLLNNQFDLLYFVKEEVINKILFNTEDYSNLFNVLITDNYKIEDKLFFYFLYKKSNLNNEQLDEKYEYLFQIIKSKLINQFKDENLVNQYISKLNAGTSNALYFRYIKNSKDLKYVIAYTDLKTPLASENNIGITNEILDKGNKKQIRKIIELLRNIGVTENNISLLAINIYMTIGYARAIDLLTNKYGNINENQLLIMFKNIIPSDILFESDGNGYKPVINEQLINLIFGSSYKISNTPIRNFLNNSHDKIIEINELKAKINNDLSLTTEEKQKQCSDLDEAVIKYNKNLKEFFDTICISFNNWDILEEEFLKQTTKMKLKLKLNLEKIVELNKIINAMKKVPELEPRDELLVQSDVFEYAFYNTQFVSDINKVPSRIVELSRRMDEVQTKKFPNIVEKYDKYTIKMYGPQDRKILSAGYRSACCFRACGNADNSGNDNSLLNYCVQTEYGGGVEITDDKGETIMFSPILRNGNVLMIHSIETNLGGNLPKECYELLVNFSKRIIEEAQQQNDDISFVVITDLHYLDTSFTNGSLPLKNKFKVYDEKSQFDGMYTNLDCNHMILASKQGRTVDDIIYGAVHTDYTFDIPVLEYMIQISEEERILIQELEQLHSEYIEISNQRINSMKNGDEEKSYKLLNEIIQKKKEYLKIYKELVGIRKSSDIYSDYKKAIRFVNSINEKLHKSIDKNIISEIICSTDWYIVITNQNEIIANALDSGKQDLMINLEKLKQSRNISLINEEGTKECSPKR